MLERWLRWSGVMMVMSTVACAGYFSDLRYRKDYRGEDGKAKVPGPAVLFPIQDCADPDSDGRVPRALHARQLARTVFPPEIWKQLRQTGEPRDGRFPYTRRLCELFFDEHDYTEDRRWELDPVKKQAVQAMLERFPGKRSLVIVFRTMRYTWKREEAAIRDSQGHFAGSIETGKTQTWENGDVQIQVRVIAPDGYVWINLLQCGPHSNDRNCGGENGKDFRNADKAVAQLLGSFPFQILEQAQVIDSLPSTPGGPPENAAGTTAPKAHVEIGAAGVDPKQRLQLTRERLERDYQNLRADIADGEANYQGWLKTATPAQLESPEYKAVADRRDNAIKDFEAIEGEHQELAKRIDAIQEAPTAEQAQQSANSYHMLLVRLRDQKSNLHKVLVRLKEISRKYKP